MRTRTWGRGPAAAEFFLGVSLSAQHAADAGGSPWPSSQEESVRSEQCPGLCQFTQRPHGSGPRAPWAAPDHPLYPTQSAARPLQGRLRPEGERRGGPVSGPLFTGPGALAQLCPPFGVCVSTRRKSCTQCPHTCHHALSHRCSEERVSGGQWGRGWAGEEPPLSVQMGLGAGVTGPGRAACGRPGAAPERPGRRVALGGEHGLLEAAWGSVAGGSAPPPVGSPPGVPSPSPPCHLQNTLPSPLIRGCLSWRSFRKGGSPRDSQGGRAGLGREPGWSVCCRTPVRCPRSCRVAPEALSSPSSAAPLVPGLPSERGAF